jgi:hypothetical protein
MPWQTVWDMLSITAARLIWTTTCWLETLTRVMKTMNITKNRFDLNPAPKELWEWLGALLKILISIPLSKEYGKTWEKK